ncbi:MAG: 3-oxoacyl-[acyl-carrier-protein] reductase [Bacillota bacterium]
MSERRVALVTGSAGALGSAICTVLASKGFDLVLHGRRMARQQELAEQLSVHGIKCLPMVADLLDPAQIAEMFDQVKAEFGRLDVLVNNAGVNKDQLLVRMTEEDFDLVLSVNLKAAFLCIQQAAKMMMRQRYGRIINITSVAGQLGTFGQANYAASKAGLIALTKTAARELAARQITVNAVAPGFIGAGMTDSLTDQQQEAFIAQVPLKRAGTPFDVANAVGFLAAEEANYITGQVLAVNGGLAMQ